jgi:hypothetical protein
MKFQILNLIRNEIRSLFLTLRFAFKNILDKMAANLSIT